MDSARETAIMRVQFLKPPILDDVTKEAVEDWNRKYENYVTQVRAEGTAAIPTRKLLCISEFVLRYFASSFGETVASLTDSDKQN